MHQDEYAQALIKALENTTREEAGEIVKRFIALVRRAGHIRLLPKIVAAYERLQKIREKRSGAIVSIAKEQDAQIYDRAIKEAVGELRVSSETITLRTDETLIGGYRVTTRDKMIDRSFKRSLSTIYHRAISD